MDYAKLMESIKGLIDDTTSPETAEKISNIAKDIEAAKVENENLLIKHEELRQKYIHALQNTAFRETEKPQDDKPMTMEECVQQVISQRK